MRPGVGVASHLEASATRPGVGVASHFDASATRPGVGVASLPRHGHGRDGGSEVGAQQGVGVGMGSRPRPRPLVEGRSCGAAHHLEASTARPGVGVASHLEASTARPGVGVASHLLPATGSRPGVGVASHLLPDGAGVATSSQRVFAFLLASAGWSHRRRFLGSPLSARSFSCSLSFLLSSSRSRALACSCITSL